MEFKVDIPFDELLSAIKNLPEEQLAIVRKAVAEKPAKIRDIEAFKTLLLNGPTWTDEEYEEFKKDSERKWRTG